MIFFSEGILDFLMAAADYHRGFGLSINYQLGNSIERSKPVTAQRGNRIRCGKLLHEWLECVGKE